MELTRASRRKIGIMMTGSRFLGFKSARWILLKWLLMCLLHDVAGWTEVVGYVGEQVLLPCTYGDGGGIKLEEFNVYWQTQVTDQLALHMIYRGEVTVEHQSAAYKHRTRFVGQIDEGNFSLLLWNITVSDSRTYNCVIVCNTETWNSVSLIVAAHYKEPIVARSTVGDEERLVCTSSGGYPKAAVDWINQTSNTLIEGSKVQTNCSCDLDTCNVTSTLHVRPTRDPIACRVHNSKTLEDKTSSVLQYIIGPSPDPTVESRTVSHVSVGGIIGIVIILAVLIVTAIVAAYVWKKRQCPHCSSRIEGLNVPSKEVERLVYFTP